MSLEEKEEVWYISVRKYGRLGKHDAKKAVMTKDWNAKHSFL